MICYEQNCPTLLNWIFCLLRHKTSISTRCCRKQSGIKLKISFREWLHAWLRPRFKLSKIQLAEPHGGGGGDGTQDTTSLKREFKKKKLNAYLKAIFSIYMYNVNTYFKKIFKNRVLRELRKTDHNVHVFFMKKELSVFYGSKVIPFSILCLLQQT